MARRYMSENLFPANGRQGLKMRSRKEGMEREDPYNVERRSHHPHYDTGANGCNTQDRGSHHFRTRSRTPDQHYREVSVYGNSDWEERSEEHRRERISGNCTPRPDDRWRTDKYRRRRSRSRSLTPRSIRGYSPLADGPQDARQMHGEEMAERNRNARSELQYSDYAPTSPKYIGGQVEETNNGHHFAETESRESSWLNNKTNAIPSNRQLRDSTRDERNDLAAIILSRICLEFNGNVELKTLCKALSDKGVINLKSSKPLKNLLMEYPSVFSFDTDGKKRGDSSVNTLEVTAKPSLKLCIDHSTKAGSCRRECGSFHICKYFFLSTCDVSSSGKRCLFGHDMETGHNKKVMRDSLLHKFPAESQGFLLQLDYRNSTTVPVICRFYNNPKGCRNRLCKFLHTCRGYVLRTCTGRAASMCDLSHDIMMDQPLQVLRSYGLEPNNRFMENDVLNLLKSTSDEQGTFQTNRQARGHEQEWSPMSASVTEDLDDDESEGGWRWMRETSRDTWEDLRESDLVESAYRKYTQANRPRLRIDNQNIRAHFSKRRMEVIGGTRFRIKRVKR